MLYHFGGLAIPDVGPGVFVGRLSPKAQIVISAAGPGAQLVLATAIVAVVQAAGYMVPRFGFIYDILPLVKNAPPIPSIPLDTLVLYLMIPTVGSRIYEQAFTSGIVYESVGGRKVEQRMFDGNYVIQSAHKKPWQKQFNLTAAYAYFYNPLRLMGALIRPKSKVCLADAALQLLGMWGLAQTIRRTFGWALRLMLGRIRRRTKAPASPIQMRSAAGGPASYDLPAADSPKRSGPHGRPVRHWRSPERNPDKAEV